MTISILTLPTVKSLTLGSYTYLNRNKTIQYPSRNVYYEKLLNYRLIYSLAVFIAVFRSVSTGNVRAQPPRRSFTPATRPNPDVYSYKL
jgi:hypothetical protein